MELSVSHHLLSSSSSSLFPSYHPKSGARVSQTTLISTCLHHRQPHPQYSVHHRIMAAHQENGSPTPTSSIIGSLASRIGEVKRVTKETNVSVKINLDGSGVADSSTGIPFLDQMLDQLASHGLFDVHVKAKGDIHIDDHHTNEDVAVAIGTGCILQVIETNNIVKGVPSRKRLKTTLKALLDALGDRKGISQFGDFTGSLDEALIHVSLGKHRLIQIYTCTVFHHCASGY